MKRIDLYFKGDVVMTNEQFNDLNELLKDHIETLKALGDELVTYGMKKGVIYGSMATCLGIGIGYSVLHITDKILSRKSKKEESNKEES